MATALKNLSDYNPATIPSGSSMVIGIIVAEWNDKITNVLCEGAIKTLEKHDVDSDNIIVKHVPGTFELTAGAKYMAEYSDVDAVICIGCVIKGDTPHFDYICDSATYGITELNLSFEIPFIFGVLTTNNEQQALDRAGGKLGNKGDEAAITAIKMVALNKNLQEN